MSVEEFFKEVLEWTATAQHPRFKRPYTDLVYEPMLADEVSAVQPIQNLHRFRRRHRTHAALDGKDV